jgi:hypothetical protein
MADLGSIAGGLFKRAQTLGASVVEQAAAIDLTKARDAAVSAGSAVAGYASSAGTSLAGAVQTLTAEKPNYPTDAMVAAGVDILAKEIDGISPILAKALITEIYGRMEYTRVGSPIPTA